MPLHLLNAGSFVGWVLWRTFQKHRMCTSKDANPKLRHSTGVLDFWTSSTPLCDAISCLRRFLRRHLYRHEQINLIITPWWALFIFMFSWRLRLTAAVWCEFAVAKIRPEMLSLCILVIILSSSRPFAAALFLPGGLAVILLLLLLGWDVIIKWGREGNNPPSFSHRMSHVAADGTYFKSAFLVRGLTRGHAQSVYPPAAR